MSEFILIHLFSKSVLDIRTRLVVTVEPETKWMPNSDSASKLMRICKILGQYDLPNYFYSFLKIDYFLDFYMASTYLLSPLFCSEMRIFVHNDCLGRRVFAPFKSCQGFVRGGGGGVG